MADFGTCPTPLLFSSPGVYAWGDSDEIMELSGPFNGPPVTAARRTPVNGRDRTIVTATFPRRERLG
jgi:hypothetical protein